MKINWKVRFKNPYFYVALILAIVAPVGVYFGINADDLTSWSMVGAVAKQAILNPYVVVTVIVSVATFLIDPTTRGISDSNRAMRYDEPKKDDSKW
ncbi:holin [Lysinibacillus odysseyi 34hs-1 = NBRC 100172]|uniref:Holin n=2 Tax=Lysinibacillus odysseyi TaxID=202611 RepID=A0A0A3INU8_9BACI|nr:holin [Lysinibacillus odysseyi 34hs-1 = NBRC 100172]